MNYTEKNSQIIDRWCKEGWEWGIPISHELYAKAKAGEWDVLLTPTKNTPHAWFGDLKDKKLLGLAAGGGQQIPIFSALGANCTVLDYSKKQCDSERLVARREGYDVDILCCDMTKPLPFADESFDIIFHPVSNCYIEDVQHVFNECFRVLKKGGRFLMGCDNGNNFIFDEDEDRVKYTLPFNPLKNPLQRIECEKSDIGYQFSHTLEEQIGGPLKAGFTLKDIYEDTNGDGNLHVHNIPTFIATLWIK